LVNAIMHTLGHLVANPAVQRKMAIEDEMYLAFEDRLIERTRELKHAKLEADRGREEAIREREEAKAEIARLKRLLEQQQDSSGGTG